MSLKNCKKNLHALLCEKADQLAREIAYLKVMDSTIGNEIIKRLEKEHNKVLNDIGEALKEISRMDKDPFWKPDFPQINLDTQFESMI